MSLIILNLSHLIFYSQTFKNKILLVFGNKYINKSNEDSHLVYEEQLDVISK